MVDGEVVDGGWWMVDSGVVEGRVKDGWWMVEWWMVKW